MLFVKNISLERKFENNKSLEYYELKMLCNFSFDFKNEIFNNLKILNKILYVQVQVIMTQILHEEIFSSKSKLANFGEEHFQAEKI